MALSYKSALTALRFARVLPIIPLAIGAVALAGCVKVVNDVRKAQPLTLLEGSEWGLQESDQFIAFKTNGQVNGNGGCNNFFGTYTQTKESLTFGPLASTKKACQGKMRAESAFFQVFQDTRSFEATHLSLLLKDAQGQPLIRLQRRDWD